MPRGRKTQSGAPAMSTQQIPGQQYGKGVEQTALQEAMPAPQASSVASPLPQRGPSAAPPGADPAAPVAAAPAAPVDPMAAFGALRDRIGLLEPGTTRPNEPITAGLPTGPGPGPEALGATHGSPLGDTLRRLSETTGDQLYARLAQQAGV